MRAGELVADHVPGAERGSPQPLEPAFALGQHLLETRCKPDGGKAVAREHVLDRVVVRQQLAVGLGVCPGEVLDLLAGALDVEPHRQRLAVGEDDVGHRIGLEVGEAALGDQPQLVAREQGVALDQRVPGRARIEPVSG